MGDNPYTIPTPEWRKKEQLERAYWGYYWSANELNEWCNLPSNKILEEMKNHDIPRRSRGEAQTVKNMKKRGEPLEKISATVPDPRIERDVSYESETDVTWSDIQ